MGCGYVIYEGLNEKKPLVESWEHFDAEEINTGNVAEYYGVLTLFEKLIELGLENEEITINGDSRLVINQMSRFWNITKGHYVQHAQLAKDISKRFKDINWEWIPREKNKHADKLSKKGLNNERRVE
jgi:ribonuclease HI